MGIEHGIGLVIALLVTAAGCGAADSPAPVVPLCDGSAKLTLRIFYSGGGMGYPGSEVRRENGIPSFAVDGQCQYFMSGGWLNQRQDEDLGWRRGLVDDDLRQALEREVGAEDLTSVYACGDGFVIHAPALVIANTRSSLTCSGGAGKELLDVFTRMGQRARDLWADGEPMDGALHISVHEEAGAEPAQRYAWPDGLASLSDYFEQDLQTSLLQGMGSTQLVPAADAAPLRALREQYLRDTEPGIGYVGAGIPVTDGSTSAAIFMRDALPYEDDRGLLPLPRD